MGRLVAALYDRTMAEAQRAGLEDRRRALLAGASGATLELGAGTGLNLALYPAAVERLVLSEPSPHMAVRLRRRTAESLLRPEVVEAGAEALPFADASFDTVVATLVLCTVDDPPGALREVARVLRPGGRLLFLEHVRSEDPAVARRQDLVCPVWRFCADGCHPNRDTLATIAASPLHVERAEPGRLPKAPQFVRPLVEGAAVR